MAHEVLVATRFIEPLVRTLPDAYRPVSLADGPPPEVMARVRCLIAQGEVRVTPDLLDALPALGLIACFNVGYDGIDVADARTRGLQVSHAPGANAPDVADFALGLILASRRSIVAGDAQVRSGGWARETSPFARSLAGSRLGVAGLGAIGGALAKRAAALDMAVAWWGPRPKPETALPRAESLLSLARDSDVLALCAKADPGETPLVSGEVLAALGRQGLLVNVARGSLVDEPALRAALCSGALGAAALDVYAEEPTPPGAWEGVPNLVLTPHIAGKTDGALRRMQDMLRANLDAFYSGRPLVTPVR